MMMIVYVHICPYQGRPGHLFLEETPGKGIARDAGLLSMYV